MNHPSFLIRKNGMSSCLSVCWMRRDNCRGRLILKCYTMQPHFMIVRFENKIHTEREWSIRNRSSWLPWLPSMAIYGFTSVRACLNWNQQPWIPRQVCLRAFVPGAVHALHTTIQVLRNNYTWGRSHRHCSWNIYTTLRVGISKLSVCKWFPWKIIIISTYRTSERTEKK